MNASRIRHALTFAIVLALPLGAAAQETPTELSVSEVQLGSSLDRGRVESPTTTFTHADGRIYAVVQVQNPARTETRVRVSLERVDGPTRSGVLLDIPARPRYRTVARFVARQAPGRYRVVVRTEDGTELSSTELTISE
ncbi:MAG: hypothetical protein VYE22_02685 [Myxococcota bacterium]|nr:hypothetical protein [Myxococcota bacterium]